jgi:ATP-dependent RNA helicase HelY
LRTALRRHPVHGCADREQHLRWAERRERLERETTALRRQVEERTHSLARTFDRVCAVLTDLGYLTEAGVSDPGRRLARIYAESDLVVAECLRRGLWDGLDAAGLAAVVSTLVYEPRRPDEVPDRLAPGDVMAVVADTARVATDLADHEARHRLDTLRRPDPGLCWAVHSWASGAALGTVLAGADLTAGDFVRWVRQLVDLLDQLTADPVVAA